MLSERYLIDAGETDFSQELPDLIDELLALRFALERAGRDKELDPGHEEIFGMGLVLARLIGDFKFINDSLYPEKKTRP